MSAFQTVAIPFVTIGNRRALTGMQIAQMPWLKEFVDQFRHCFEYFPEYDALFYIEPEVT